MTSATTNHNHKILSNTRILTILYLLIPSIMAMFVGRFTRSNLFLTSFRQRASLQRSLSSTASNHIIALDFDGVICASAEESSASAIRTAQKLWPTVMKSTTENKEQYQQLLQLLQQVRPVVEAGYDGVLLSRYIYDNAIHLQVFSPPELIVENLLDVWNAKFREDLIQYYNIDQYSLIDSFGKIRDEIISHNLSYWVSLNKIYPHILHYLTPTPPTPSSTTKGSLNSHIDLNKDRLYIITTKQERFVRAILDANHLSSVLVKEGRSNSMPLTEKEEDELQRKQLKKFDHHNNIFDLENVYGSKLNVLKELLHQHSEGSSSSGEIVTYPTLHFVEDRYETLINIKKQREEARRRSKDGTTILDHLRLYLVDWGYNTEKQRTLSESDPDITLLSPDRFLQLLNKIQSKDD